MLGHGVCLFSPLSVVRCPLSVVRCPLSVVRCPLSVVRCPLSVVRCPLSVVKARLEARWGRLLVGPLSALLTINQGVYMGAIGPILSMARPNLATVRCSDDCHESMRTIAGPNGFVKRIKARRKPPMGSVHFSFRRRFALFCRTPRGSRWLRSAKSRLSSQSLGIHEVRSCD